MVYINIVHWSFLLAIFRLILGGVFLASVVSKVNRLYNFELTIRAFKLTPLAWSKPIAFILVFIETIIAILLLLGWKSQLAAIASGLLLTVFTIAIVINLFRRNNNLECGCFGNIYSSKINTNLIWRNLVLLSMSLFIALWGEDLKSIDITIAFLKNLSIEDIFLPFVIFVFGLYILFLLLQRLYYMIQIIFKEEK